MRYKLLGRSGLRVSELCLGTMTFGTEWGWGADLEESRRIFSCFADRGGNFIDTANKYTDGTSEKMVGEFIAPARERFVLATKYTLSMDPSDPNACGNHRKNMVQSLEASLRRLRTDYIDLFWLHAWDDLTPIEEIMRGLDDLVRSGKVLYVGISDTPAWIVSQAITLADLRGWSRFVGLQIEYSLRERTVERELLPMARALDVGVTAWAPLGAGLLTGKYSKGDTGAADAAATGRLAGEAAQRHLTPRNLKISEEVVAIAGELGRSPAQVALAWLQQQPWGVVIPILGARTLAQVEDNLGCRDVVLDADKIARLDEVSRVDLGFPHEFLRREPIRQVMFGDCDRLIDRHRR